jgi:hypothetical protein
VTLLDRLRGWTDGRDGDGDRRQAELLYRALLEEARPTGILTSTKELPSGRKILGECPPEIQGAVLEIACEEIVGALERHVEHWRPHVARDIITGLLKRKVTVPARRVVAILDTCSSIGNAYCHLIPVRSLLSLVSRPPTPEEVDALHRLQSAVEQSIYAGPRKLSACIQDILNGDEHALLPGGTWSARMLSDISQLAPNRRDAWCDLVKHLLAAGDSAPSKKWESQLHLLLQAVGKSSFLQTALDWLALGPMPGRPTTPQVPDRDADYLKGFVWSLGAFDETSVPRALADLAEQCLKKVPNHGPVSARVGNACIRVLARLGGTEPVAQLGRLRTRVKYAVGTQLIEKALMEAATRAGLTPEELEEIAVPTFDLDKAGGVQWKVGSFVADVRITGTDGVALSWLTAEGTRQKSVPAAVREGYATELNRIKKTVKDIAGMLAAQRVRLERLLESDRQIPLEAWRQRYLEHPLVGQMSRRLIWRFSQDQRTVLGAVRDGGVVDVNDEPIDWLSTSSMVRVWHPLGHAPELVLAWRRWLERSGIVQPFKQAHREIYLLTDAERITETYSNRFAAHILRQHQFAALCRERGWQYRLQGDWDSANTPVRKLPRWNLEIQFWVDAPMDRTGLAQSGVFQFICTDQVRFYREAAPVRLEDVPSIAFSEAMRDVDLFVGVCSVGNDPTWPNRGAEQYGGYWHNYSFGELSASAKTRSGVLEALIPKLKIAARLSLEERFLVVRGDLATYKIHLGSGNVLIEPGSRYLCIVPARGENPVPLHDVWLPFEGDGALSIILSKALMLAADTKITDPLIRLQIRG